MTIFIASFLFVVLAEMGDKTQLLAMAFATRYAAGTVLTGVLVATLVNHLLAVVLGNWLTDFIPLDHVQIAASASFILFGLWTLRGDELEGEDRKYSFSPFWTVTVAFFFAEMGDKTQLATVALAAKYHSIPERFVKWFAATVFIIFGIIGLYDSLPGHLLTPGTMAGGLFFVTLMIALVLLWNRRRELLARKNGVEDIE
jgi:putative Ca2+/H+ antiporter (TMEM165/GDT1 family)